MQTITCKYLDSSGIVHTAVLDALSVRGFDEPDDVRFVPPLKYQFSDFRVATAFKGFQRIVTIQLAPLSDGTKERFLQLFLVANVRSVTYQGDTLVSEEMFTATERPDAISNEWLEGFQYAKVYTLRLVENYPRKLWPQGVVPTDTDIMYIAKKIKVEGTQAAPETFQTNLGKLLYNYGTTSFPPISLLSYLVSVDCDGTPYQDCHVNQVGDVAQVGSDISFELAISDGGNPSGDGYYYADIKIMLQPIV